MQNIGSQLQIWRRDQTVSLDRTKWRSHHGIIPFMITKKQDLIK